MSKLRKNKQYYDKDWTTDKAKDEIEKGLSILNGVNNKIVSFFGSSRAKEDSEDYSHCNELAFNLGKEGYAILTGGGPGIMHAANSGATKAGAPSIGFNTDLLEKEKIADDIFTEKESFHFLFVRRFLLSIKSEALIFYPGGYGTLNELFEYVMLIQTKIADKVPIICIGKDYWSGLMGWLEEKVLQEDRLWNNKSDLNLINIVDDLDEVKGILKSI